MSTVDGTIPPDDDNTTDEDDGDVEAIGDEDDEGDVEST